MRLGHRVARALGVTYGEFDADPRHQLERRQLRAGAELRALEEVERGFRRGKADISHLASGRLGQEFEDGRGDDTERAFCTDQEMAPVIAAIVLLQPSQAVQDFAGRQHRFQPEAEVAAVAVGEHSGAAGVGRQIAADLAGALRAKRQRVEQPRLVGRLLDALQDDPRLHDHRAPDGIDIADAVHA